MAELSNFMIGTVLVIGIFATLFSFSGHVFQQYDTAIPAKYNKTFLTLSNMTPMTGITEELKDASLKENSSETAGFFGNIADRFDLSGLFIVRVYKALQIFPKTINVFMSMGDNVLDAGGDLFGIATPSLRFIIGAVIIIVIMTALLAALIKWWL